MKKRGFTLVELLVVVAIISILAGLMMTSLGSARAKSRDGVRKSDLNQIRTAIEQSGIDNGGSYPQSTAAGAPTANTTSERWAQSGALGPAMTSLQDAQYLSVVPRPARPGNNYGYATNTQGFRFFSPGSDGTTLPLGSDNSVLANTQYVLEARLERPTVSNSIWEVRSNGISSEHPGTASVTGI